MSVQVLQQIAETRRSVYALNKDLPIAASEVAQIVEHAIKHTPSSFNSQSTRAVVLFGAEHEKLWDIAINELRKIVPAENFQPTEDKLNMFKAAAGSVLFFEDQKVVKGLQEQFCGLCSQLPCVGRPRGRDDAIRDLDDACRSRRGRELAALQPCD